MVEAQVPHDVAVNVVAFFGERGRHWLDALPDVVSHVASQWRLSITSVALQGGTHSFVVKVQREDGTPAVLKVPVVDEENVAEATALFHYGGDAAVLLHEFDPRTGALLIELADPGEPLVRQDVEGPHLEGRPENAERVRLACRHFRRLWRVPAATPPSLPKFPLVTDMVRRWGEDMPPRARRLGPRIPTDLMERFSALCAEYVEPTEPQGIVNRDTHLGNIVSAQRMPWLLIDPKPFYGERAFEAGFLAAIQAESLPERADLRAMFDRVAAGLGVSPAKVRGWGFLRLMENAIGAVESDDPCAGPQIEAARLVSDLDRT